MGRLYGLSAWDMAKIGREVGYKNEGSRPDFGEAQGSSKVGFWGFRV